MPIVASPRTWVVGETVPAAVMNTDVRDQFQAIRDSVTTSATTTVANTTTETVVGTYTISANQPVAGSVYRMVAFGNISNTGTPTITWRARIGGVSGTLLCGLGPTTPSTGSQSSKEVRLSLEVVCLTTGSSGTWFGLMTEQRNWHDSGTVSTVQINSSDGAVTRDTTASNSLVITAQWGTANASNTMTIYRTAWRVV